jgi:hypothetical protein
MAKKIGKDLGPEARNRFHNMKDLTDRTMEELGENARTLYEEAGKRKPWWLP